LAWFSFFGAARTYITARCIAEYVSIVLLPFIFGAQKVVLKHRQTTLDSPAWRKVDLGVGIVDMYAGLSLFLACIQSLSSMSGLAVML
jgi:hypothetical protein